MSRENIIIPEKLKSILNSEDLGTINLTAAKFGKIYDDNRMYFFPEYTNHGIKHIEDVLNACSELISESTYPHLESRDINVLILSAILHDVGMHIAKEPLLNLINYDETIIVPGIDQKSWREEWQEFFHEARRFNEVKLEQIFGDKNIKIVELDFKEKEDYSRRLLGEFLRRMHPRLAHEIAVQGYPTLNENIVLSEDISSHIKELSGLVARSHGMELRDTFKYLEEKYSKAWASPYNIKVIYLMTVLRIADYIQIQSDRANKLILQTRRLSSSISIQEWEKHNAIEFINTETDDPERIYVHASPNTSLIFLELHKLFRGIQYELDISWAVLGEVYGRHENYKKLGLKYRRIQSNIDDKDKFQKTVAYIPEKVIFDADPEILKLLIGPLYGEDPKFGIRELLQNSIDATKERKLLDKDKVTPYEPRIQIKIVETSSGKLVIIIHDNGVGMNKDTLINYFFKAGASFRKSEFWQKKFGPTSKVKLDRVGRFGVGVLAAYLLGDEIIVTTKHTHSNDGLRFEAKLTSRQIELVKVNCDIGTKIEITLKKEVAEMFSKNSSLEWFTWYKLNNPKIEFLIDQKFESRFVFNGPNSYVPSIDEENPQWRNFSTEFFGEIKWTMDKTDIHRSLSLYKKDYRRSGDLLINGFFIPGGYKFLLSKYSWSLPIVSVFDINGVMPLSLNRNYIQENSLPFETELLENISKDIIAKLLTLEVNQYGCFHCLSEKSRYLKYRQSIDLRPNIIFVKDSFTLDLPLILYKLNIDTLPVIWIKKSEPQTPTTIFKNGYISIVSNLGSIPSFSNAMDNVVADNNNSWFTIFGGNSRRALAWRRIFLKKEKYDYLMHGKRLRLGFKSKNSDHLNSKNWISFINDHNPDYLIPNILPKEKREKTPASIEIDNLDLINSEIDLIIENKFGYYEQERDYGYYDMDENTIISRNVNDLEDNIFNVENISQFKIFELLLEKYLGTDYLIPIDLEERKKKFSLAFKDLSEQINFHLSH